MDTEWCIVCDSRIHSDFSNGTTTSSAFCSMDCMLSAYLEAAREPTVTVVPFRSASSISDNSSTSSSSSRDSMLKRCKVPVVSHFSLEWYGSDHSTALSASVCQPGLSEDADRNSSFHPANKPHSRRRFTTPDPTRGRSHARRPIFCIE